MLHALLLWLPVAARLQASVALGISAWYKTQNGVCERESYLMRPSECFNRPFIVFLISPGDRSAGMPAAPHLFILWVGVIGLEAESLTD